MPMYGALLTALTLSLTLETYYQYNWNRPAGRVNALRAYDVRANSFSIQQAAAVLENAPDRAAGRPFGLRVDLQYGQATEALQGSPANEPLTHVSYAATGKLSLDADISRASNQRTSSDPAATSSGSASTRDSRRPRPTRWRSATSTSTTRASSAASHRRCRR
jgi:hypothetical protein